MAQDIDERPFRAGRGRVLTVWFEVDKSTSPSLCFFLGKTPVELLGALEGDRGKAPVMTLGT